jgi:hypothetical protein
VRSPVNGAHIWLTTSGPAIERIDAVHLLRLLEPSRSRYLAGEAAGNAVSTKVHTEKLTTQAH